MYRMHTEEADMWSIFFLESNLRVFFSGNCSSPQAVRVDVQMTELRQNHGFLYHLCKWRL